MLQDAEALLLVSRGPHTAALRQTIVHFSSAKRQRASADALQSKAANILFLFGLAKGMQDPINHGAQNLHHPPAVAAALRQSLPTI